MKNCSVLLALSFALPATAQHGYPEEFLNYCGFATNDSIDITHDGIPDLVVVGFRSGTDDEPSSSGNCYLQVATLRGTALLNIRDPQGYWRTEVCSQGEHIAAVDTSAQDDLRIPQTTYTIGSVQVAYWGYGGQAEPFTVAPDLSTQRFVFRTKANGRAWHGSFSIEPPAEPDQVRIRVGAMVTTDQPFVVR